MNSVHSVAASLSGYLCGTHSGLLAATRSTTNRSTAQLRTATIAEGHRRLQSSKAPNSVMLSNQPWEPKANVASLRDALAALAARPEVIDIVIFGSQARQTTTGFSDVDAIVVIHDDVADSEKALKALRTSVLAAERAVLAYQPMQHHSFLVATPRLLDQADAALHMPAIALAEARRVVGGNLIARFDSATPDGSSRFLATARSLANLRTWPRHPWEIHRLVSMFKLLPALYLQARGTAIPKWRSFAEAEPEFGSSWWPYDALAEIRHAWPKEARPALYRAAVGVRNPWLAVALWRRLPADVPLPVRPLLDQRLLRGLQKLTDTMEARLR